MLSKNAVLEYQENYKKEFGREISYEEAQEQGTKLLRLFKLIYQPVPKDWITNRNNKKGITYDNKNG